MRGRVTIFSKMLFVFIVPIIAGFGCKDNSTEPLPRLETIQLSVVDIGVSDAYLKIVFNVKGYENRKFTLERDGRKILTSNVIGLDTIKEDPWLLPKHTYKYRAYRLDDDNNIIDSSNLHFVTTGDTTSQTFTWQNFLIGELGSSFEDVAVINDTCVWAVGEIYISDSIDTPPYNVAKWDGKEWHFTNATNVALRAVIAFNDTNVWVGSSAPYHWNGQVWRGYNVTGIFGGHINKFWGTNSNNLYMVGTNGAIAHFDGTNWQKLESGTTLDIKDIWGGVNNITDKLEIFAVASKADSCQILKLEGTTVTEYSSDGIDPPADGIWFIPGRKYYVVGRGIYTKKSLNDHNPWMDYRTGITPNYNMAIRGNSIKDFVVACTYGDIIHYNGYAWKRFWREINLGYGIFESVAMRDNMIVAVGYYNGRGGISIGKR